MSFSRDLKALPKAHLHIHLEGAMRPETLAELCRRYGIQRPLDTRGKRFSNFTGFNDVYRAACDCIRSRNDLARVILEVAQDAAAQGALWIEPAFDAERYSELRNDSPYRLFENQKEGWEFAISAAETASQSTGVGIGYISAIDRTKSPQQGLYRAQITAELVRGERHMIRSRTKILNGHYPGIVGLGLHGNEEGHPPELFEEVFRVGLEDTGLLSTPHAGEIPPFPNQGAKSVASAVKFLDADRIQHGVLAFNNAALLERLALDKICFDVCPSSNIQLSVFPTIESHPLPHLLEAGLPCSIGSDDPLLFGPSLLDEFNLCREEIRLSDKTIAQISRNSFIHSGAPPEIIASSIIGIDEWLGAGP